MPLFIRETDFICNTFLAIVRTKTEYLEIDYANSVNQIRYFLIYLFNLLCSLIDVCTNLTNLLIWIIKATFEMKQLKIGSFIFDGKCFTIIVSVTVIEDNYDEFIDFNFR